MLEQMQEKPIASYRQIVDQILSNIDEAIGYHENELDKLIWLKDQMKYKKELPFPTHADQVNTLSVEVEVVESIEKENEYLAQEAADYLEISLTKLYQSRSSGEGPKAEKKDRKLVFKQSDLDAWKSAQIK